MVSDFIKEKDIVVLVTPFGINNSEENLVFPEELAVKDILSKNGIVVISRFEELKDIFEKMRPKLVITDSLVFDEVKNIVPDEIDFTSFSILMARYKGFLDTAIEGTKQIDKLEDGDKVLISEGCTHHRQCDDIGTVKIPKWLKTYTGKELDLEWSSGTGFPENLSKYKLVIHCGGCMLNANEMIFRMNSANAQGVPFTNYGITIAYMKGILDRSIKPIADLKN